MTKIYVFVYRLYSTIRMINFFMRFLLKKNLAQLTFTAGLFFIMINMKRRAYVSMNGNKQKDGLSQNSKSSKHLSIRDD